MPDYFRQIIEECRANGFRFHGVRHQMVALIHPRDIFVVSAFRVLFREPCHHFPLVAIRATCYTLRMNSALPSHTYSVLEAARVLGVPPRTIYGQVARGELPAIRLSGRILILRSVIVGILASGLPAPERAPEPVETDEW
jgi:excisionase family DNA binding protein